ncbi:MAG: hypothetical protein ABIW79_10920 [Gemmatimonas sp.]
MTVTSSLYAETVGRDRVEFAGVLILCWIVIAIAISQFPDGINGGRAFGIILVLGMLAFAPFLLVTRYQSRRRARRATAMLRGDGFEVEYPPAAERASALLEQVGGLAMLRNSPEDIEWIARKTIDGRAMIALRHSHLASTSTGHAYDRTSTVVSLEIRDSRPGVWLTRTNVTTRHRDEDSAHAQDLQVGDAWFDANFRVQSHEMESVQRIVTSDVRAYLAEGPVRESWAIGYGYVVCVFGADTNADGISVMMARTTHVAELVQRRQTIATTAQSSSVPAA